jgi:quinol monooxygenase YgiN
VAIVILEVAEFFIRPGSQAEFDAAIRRGVETVIAHSPGFRRYQVQRSIESPQRYLLFIEWERLENHTVDFRGSAAFTRWREIVSPYFAQAPKVEHFERVAGS